MHLRHQFDHFIFGYYWVLKRLPFAIEKQQNEKGIDSNGSHALNNNLSPGISEQNAPF